MCSIKLLEMPYVKLPGSNAIVGIPASTESIELPLLYDTVQ